MYSVTVVFSLLVCVYYVYSEIVYYHIPKTNLIESIPMLVVMFIICAVPPLNVIMSLFIVGYLISIYF
jgi:hypothetical protein